MRVPACWLADESILVPHPFLFPEDWLETFGTYGQRPNNAGLGYYLPTSDESLVVSILSAGTFFGALAAYPIGE